LLWRLYGLSLSKWFYDTFTGAAIGAARCGSFVAGGLVSWSLAMDERSGHKDLCGSDSWSIIPYVHRRTELYCSSLPCLSQPFLFVPAMWCLLEPFIAQGRTIILRPEARQVAPMWLKSYTTSRVLMDRSSKWCLAQCLQRGAVLSYRSAALNMTHRRGDVLLGHITTVAISMSDQLDRCCTIKPYCSGLHVCRCFSNAWECFENTRA
jgi:hypothetical protein